MTIKEFLSNHILTSVEIIDDYDLIINLVCEEVLYGIDVNTTNIPSGTPITRRYDFTLINDILSVDQIQVDTNTTNML